MAIARDQQQATAAIPAIVGTIHEGVPVRDLATSVRFYQEALGLQLLPRPNLPAPGAWLGYPAGGIQIHLIAETGDHVPGAGAPITPTGRHTAFVVSDLDRLRAHWRALDLPYQEITGLVGSDQVFITDPDGHTLEFQQARQPAGAAPRD